MPGITPLLNVKLQSSLNLASKPLTATNPAKRFILKNVSGTTKVIDVTDMSRLLKFEPVFGLTITLNADLAGVVAGDTFTVTANTSSITPNGTAAAVYNSFFDVYNDAIVQFIYVGSNTWIIINAN
jgi:hypothetical protein